ncbi:response regulator [Sphingomonas sp. CL5.1]|uniref:response regulator transcription factor n=1 Tax=Sphingomonas sp. CL5.1 TaxID=2653203 RepID=UPI0015825D7A|nr:response regulator [Sphingomonas sp. CL5.1]QKS00537.1 response regulator [Sphingomonas sp. CL5.1]
MPQPRILLVDDDPAVLAAITFALEIEGFDVAAYDSAAALLAGGQDILPACIVLDHRLPGIDGLELLAQLRGHGLGAAAIIITSNPSQNLRRRVREAGARLVEKPLLCDELVAAIRRVIMDEPNGRDA